MTISFGGIKSDAASFEKSKAVIIPVPYGRTVTYRKGTEKGPLAILKASEGLELFDEELNKETYRIGIHTYRPLSAQGLSPKKMVRYVERKVESVIAKDKLPVIIGGEHTVAIGAIRAAAKQIERFSVLQLDAHCDLRNEYFGSRYNHACFARRAVEIAPVVQVGIRSMSKEESDFLPHPKIRIISAHDIQNDRDWIKNTCRILPENVYVSIDLDVFDTGIMPSIGTPEPGGLGWYDILGFLKAVSKKRNIIGFDVVELCPIKDQIAPDFLAAKLIYKFLGYIACS